MDAMLAKLDVMIINVLTVICFLAVIFFEFQEASTYVGGIGNLF